jgi:hypothetical protein
MPIEKDEELEMRKSPILNLLLLTLVISGPVQAQTVPNKEIIDRWVGGDREDASNSVYKPWLIPVDLLKMKYEDWGPEERARIPKATYEKFHAMVAGVAASGRPYDCAFSSISLYSDGPQKPITLLRIAEVSQEVVIGEVEKVVPVWELDIEKLSSLVYLRVEESLKGTIPVGTVIKYYRSDAIAKIGRVTLCSRRYEYGKRPRQFAENDVTWLTNEQQHSTYMVVGRLSQANRWFLESAPPSEFKVLGGAAFNAGEPTGLNEIYQRLASYQALTDQSK